MAMLGREAIRLRGSGKGPGSVSNAEVADADMKMSGWSETDSGLDQLN